MNIILVFSCILIFLVTSGTLISTSIAYTKCSKTLLTSSFYEGIVWALPITFTYIILNIDYTKGYTLPIFSEPFAPYTGSPELIGTIYALILITSIMTARMFHTTDIAICNPSKDELKAFEKKLEKELKEKENHPN